MPPAAPLPQLTGIPKSFEMSGRLSIRQADRSDIARLRWTRAGGSDQWVFSSPIGNEVARIESRAGTARLERAGAPAEEAATFSELTQRVLGVALDPDQFSAWLHGKSGGGPSGLPAEWKVTIDETQSAGSVDLARRVTATRGDIVLKLVVDEYRALGD